jgi:hypothetical protein
MKFLQDYMVRLYETDAVKPTVNMTHIKHHYYKSHPTVMQDRLGVGEDLPQPEVGELRGYTVNDSGWLQEFDVEDRQDEAGGLAGMIIQHQITLTPQRRGPTLGLSM